jgi:hypothetical protein
MTTNTTEGRIAFFTHRPASELRKEWRYWAWFNHDIDLKQMPDEVLNEVILRFYMRAAVIRARRGLEEWIQDEMHIDDVGRQELVGEMIELIEEVFGGEESKAEV